MLFATAEKPLIDPATLVFIAGVLVVIFFLMRRGQGYFARTNRAGSRVAAPADLPSVATGSEETAKLEVAMHDASREFFGKLDGKIAALEYLLAEADRTIAKLEAARKAASESQPNEPAAEAEPTISAKSERHEAVYRLADEGLAVEQIADRLAMPAGEVGLILGLRGKRVKP